MEDFRNRSFDEGGALWPESYADSGSRASGSAPTLICPVGRFRLRDESIQPASGMESVDSYEPRVDDSPDSGHGEACFGDARREDDARPGALSRFQHIKLFPERDGRVEPSHIDPGISGGYPSIRGLYLRHAGEENEDISATLPRECLGFPRGAFRDIGILRPGMVSGFDRMHEAWHGDR